jgi:hypothetical protein
MPPKSNTVIQKKINKMQTELNKMKKQVKDDDKKVSSTSTTTIVKRIVTKTKK